MPGVLQQPLPEQYAGRARPSGGSGEGAAAERDAAVQDHTAKLGRAGAGAWTCPYLRRSYFDVLQTGF